MSSALDLLELRVKAIEDEVLGRDASRVQNKVSLVDQLVQIDGKLKELTTGKERFNNCFQKCRQLDKYLDTEYLDRISCSDSAKLDTILTFEDEIKCEAQSLERVEQLTKNIDSPHIRDYQKFESKLSQIRFIGLQQSQESTKIEDKSRQLIVSYNEWLENIKRQLTSWDLMLTQLEDKHKLKQKRNKVDID